MSHLFLLDVQVADGGPTPEAIANRLRDSLFYMEKIGEIDTSYLGLTEVEGEMGFNDRTL